MDRVETRTAPLTRDESFVYDLMGSLISWTDRKSQVTTYQYDATALSRRGAPASGGPRALENDRQTFVGFGTTGGPTYASTITTTYDAGDRATDIVDSVAGTIARTYDLLDRLTEEVTPEGTVTYTYDDADRRATMTVAGQTAVSYTYDNADRLTGVTRGAAAVTVAYDNADKRLSLTLPNGIVVEYAYDDDSRLTGLTYKLGLLPRRAAHVAARDREECSADIDSASFAPVDIRCVQELLTAENAESAEQMWFRARRSRRPQR